MSNKYFFLLLLALLFQCRMSSQQTDHLHTNHLISENSPYLLQHAHNPVDWYPWSDEALALAAKEDKLLVISIGYAACHWCHVMEHESFEDDSVAMAMNSDFVSIKVDREERPDIDDVYMTACQLSSGRGCGWPLNAFALPDGRPVWAGTYFPKDQWMGILKQFRDLWQNDRQKLEDYADKLTSGIKSQDQIMVGAPTPFERSYVDTMAAGLQRSIDWDKGGRSGAPKFPMPVNFSYLLDHHVMTGDAKSLEAVNITLDEMGRGGIYDQLGGGFARYSVDDEWLVPHFEKMMYDNGQLMSLYSKAYQVTGKQAYRRVIAETTDWLAREMTNDVGGFYSSLDADSDGEEGKFYVWTWDELMQLVAPDDFDVFTKYYGCTQEGNWEHEKNILHMPIQREAFIQEEKISEGDLDEILSRNKEALFAYREKRIRPGLDDKILTSWNALMLRGLVDAYKALGEDRYLQMALKNAEFLRDNLLKEGNRLDRNYKDGTTKINAFLDDYTLLTSAYLALYEVTFDISWLNLAKSLTDYAIEHFYDDTNKLFNYTSDLDAPLVARKKEINDNVIPASNSSMARNLNYLAHYFSDDEYSRMSDRMIFNITEPIVQSGQTGYYANWALLYLEKLHSTYEVVIMGSDHAALRAELQKTYYPNTIYLGGETETFPLMESKLVEDRTMIYICQNRVCQFPVSNVADAREQIKYL